VVLVSRPLETSASWFGLETRDLGLSLGVELPSLGLCLSGLGLGLEMSGLDNNTGFIIAELSHMTLNQSG